jgi:hypothetical protein
LDTGSIANAKLANSSITVTAGTGMSGGGTVALGGTVTLTNAGIISLTGSTYINVGSGSNPTVGLQQTSTTGVANTVAIRDSVGGLVAQDYTATHDVSITTDHGAFNYGSLNYTDSGIMGNFSNATSGGYNQIILQNTAGADGSSTNYIVSNDLGTKNSNYGEFGMNSSGFTGAGSLNLPSAVYVNSSDSSLVLGGTDIRFVIGGATTDAVTITDTEIDTYNNYILKDGNDNILLQLQNEGGIGKLKFNGGSQGIWYDGGVVINGVGYHADYSGIQPMSYNSATGQVTYGLIDYTHLTNTPTLTNGTVTSVGGTGTVSGLTLSGTVTSTGNLTLGGTLALTSGNVTTALGYTPYSNTNPAGYTNFSTNQTSFYRIRVTR